MVLANFHEVTDDNMKSNLVQNAAGPHLNHT